tara:strand:- start:31725 stop:32948 length:1224 start_codon:yes stop_codon:yes gene_type:complete
VAAEDYRALFGDDFDDILDALTSGGLSPEVEKMILQTVDRMVFNTNIFAEGIKGAVSNMKAQGLSDDVIMQTLQNDMTSGGRIFGQLRNGTKEGIVQGINRSAAIGQYEAYSDGGYNENSDFEWITVSGHRICIDCTGREGMIMPFKEWESLGFPGSGWSVCGGYCYCVIDPVGKMDKNINVDVKEKGAKKPPPGYRPTSYKESLPYVKRALAKAGKSEPAITRLIRKISKDLDIEMSGLEYRKKGFKSAQRKFQKESIENFWGPQTVTLEDFSDLVRFTCIVDDARYVDDVLSYFNRLEAAGYRRARIKNYWNGTEYKGLNTNWIAPDGTMIEMQFNTARSQFIKDKYSHTLYEKIRQVGISSVEKDRLTAEMIKWWDTVDAPPGWERIKNFQGESSFPAGWNVFD